MSWFGPQRKTPRCPCYLFLPISITSTCAGSCYWQRHPQICSIRMLEADKIRQITASKQLRMRSEMKCSEMNDLTESFRQLTGITRCLSFLSCLITVNHWLCFLMRRHLNTSQSLHPFTSGHPDIQSQSSLHPVYCLHLPWGQRWIIHLSINDFHQTIGKGCSMHYHRCIIHSHTMLMRPDKLC